MTHLSHNNLRLLARNEGKIKTYESCSDIRAWSHDLRVRDKYLRDWIKRDMPIYVIPIDTLTSLLRTMTCKSRGRAMPRCHPNCKSKILLESICASCTAMKDCLLDNQNLGKYFEEEDLETSHWPCERCLQALKSIKMFWKIIIEKILNINVSKQPAFENCDYYSRIDSVKCLAKVWHSEIIEQAKFIKNVMTRKSNLKNTYDPGSDVTCLNNETTKLDSHIAKTKNLTEKLSNGDCPSRLDLNRSIRKSVRKLNKCTSARIKMVDVGCNTCSMKKENEKIKAYKANIEFLQNNYNTQRNEMERLRQENNSLKIDLQNAYKCCNRKPAFCTPAVLHPDCDKVIHVPQPFDTCGEENIQANTTKEIESEMIITMKNSKNENFKHVSLLQVLHKTNQPVPNEINTRIKLDHRRCCNNENPIDLLTRVHKTFGEIVNRELSIAGDRQHCANKFDITATFHKVAVSRSAPSCSTVSSCSTSTLSASPKDVICV